MRTKPLISKNPPLVFWQDAEETMTRRTAEGEFAKLLTAVATRLSEAGLDDTQAQAAWRRVQATLSDPEEMAFCEAAGALGADPYAISDDDAAFIEDAGKVHEGESLLNFLGTIRSREQRPITWNPQEGVFG